MHFVWQLKGFSFLNHLLYYLSTLIRIYMHIFISKQKGVQYESYFFSKCYFLFQILQFIYTLSHLGNSDKNMFGKKNGGGAPFLGLNDKVSQE